MALRKSTIDRSLYRKNQQREVEDSYATKDSGSFKSIFDQSKVRDFKFFSPAAGEHIIDILPYLVGEQHPKVLAGKLEVGTGVYMLELWVHYGVGPNEDQYICLAKTYNEKCPICEHRQEIKSEDEEAAKALLPKRRTIYAVLDLDNESKGVQLWNVAHFFMENHLATISKKPKGGGYVLFADPDVGKSISFTIKGKGIQQQYHGHQFVDRDEPIADELLMKVPCLDELIHIPNYDEVYSAFWGKKTSVEEDDGDDQHLGNDEGPEQTCPYGAEFGKDFNEFDECDACKVREECEAVANPPFEAGPEPEPEKEPAKRPTLRRKR